MLRPPSTDDGSTRCCRRPGRRAASAPRERSRRAAEPLHRDLARDRGHESGIEDRRSSRCSAVGPGTTRFTVVPVRATSRASVRANPTSPALEAAYAPWLTLPIAAATDDTITIRPRGLAADGTGCGASHAEGPGEIGRDHGLPVLVAQVGHSAVAGDGGRGDEVIEATEARNRPPDLLSAFVGRGDRRPDERQPSWLAPPGPAATRRRR